MNGNTKLITVLNSLLTDELITLNQYIVHSGIYENGGYVKLHMAARKLAMDKMQHAEWLIDRIISLDGTPAISDYNAIKIGNSISEIIRNESNNELDAVSAYNEAIKLAREVGVQGTVGLLKEILKMEESHAVCVETG